ncbi:MAG: SMC family ATPase, partial [Candidatus Obscuribacterales bacterium]|nr:SMC family ATPase [Candidatus Obscuribacterales bacterium]
MIINSLTLHNFMSYADAKLDLTSVAVACLTGLNGAGKSALLDAITWALWESARASSDEIIRLGQSEMWVDLCFSLEQQVYRVRRARQKSFGRGGQQSTSRANLDFQVWDGSINSWNAKNSSDSDGDEHSNGNGSATDSWKTLNGASIRETQKRLRELLRMDYETFVSSVYLRQGRADEFTMRSPNERKQVFSDILGLDYFDKLQEIAREEARERKGRIQILEAGLSDKSEFEQAYFDSVADIQSLSTETEQCASELAACVALQVQLDSEIAKLNYLQIRAETARVRSAELKADLESFSRRADDLQSQQRKLKLLVDQSDTVGQMFRDFEECKELAYSFDIKASKYSDLSSRRMELRSKIGMLQGRMEVEFDHLKVT